MKPFVPTKRQSLILKMLREDGFVATDAMVSHFNVTPQTIRRDLNELSAKGLITRFHGGAGHPRNSGDRPYEDRLVTHVEGKKKIAEILAKKIPNNASLFLNTGTTIEAVARELLGHENLTVVTNNINVAQTLRRNESFNIMLAGGQLRNADGGIIGPQAIEFIDKFHMNYGIIGVNSIDDDGHLWDYGQVEIRLSQATMKNADQTILVADAAKFGKKALCRMGHVEAVDVVVTDAPITPHFKTLFETHDVSVYHDKSAAERS
jgi:DeoR family glycerol-3-phosphate regulon repressor